MKKIMSMMFIMVLLGTLVGCAKDVAVTEAVYEDITAADETTAMTTIYPLTIVDKFGDEITIETEPMKVISLSPEMTEIIFGIGGGDKLIGRSSYCDYPAMTSEIDDYGSLTSINIETVIAADPDVIFVSSMATDDSVAALKDQGIKVIALDKDSSLEGTYEYFNAVGKVINRQSEALALETSIKGQIEGVATQVEGLEAPTLYYVVYAAEGYDSAATGDTFIHEIIEVAGGDNVAKDGTDWSYSIEKLVEQDPEIVICSEHGDAKASVENLTGYKDLTAVLEGRLFEVDANIFSRQGPRIGDAVVTLAKILHPEVFE